MGLELDLKRIDVEMPAQRAVGAQRVQIGHPAAKKSLQRRTPIGFDEELAALAVVLSALRRQRGTLAPPENPRIAGGWKSYWHTVRGPLFPGRDAWRATLRR